jgi:hypothetical protein
MAEDPGVSADVNEDRDVAEYTVDVEEFFESQHVHAKPITDQNKKHP